MINTCEYCGKLHASNTKLVGGLFILESCKDCEIELQEILQKDESRKKLLNRARELNCYHPLFEKYSNEQIEKFIDTFEEMDSDDTQYLE